MNWDLLLVAILLLAAAKETRSWRKSRASRDLAAFYLVWAAALAAAAADMAELPGFRPLDWIRSAMQPLNRFIP